MIHDKDNLMKTIGQNYLDSWEKMFSVEKLYVKDALFHGTIMGGLFSKRRYRHTRFRNVVFTSIDIESCNFTTCIFEGCHFENIGYGKGVEFESCRFDTCTFKTVTILWDGQVEISWCDFVNCSISSFYIRSGSVSVTHSNFDNVLVKSSFNTRFEFMYNNQGVIDAGRDSRGYHFFGFWHEDQWKVLAGCRWFTEKQAVDHWSWSYKSNTDALARVRLITESPKPVFLQHIDRSLVPEAVP